MKKIVFMTGYSGAGKSTLTDYVVGKYRFGYVSFRDTTREVAESQGYTHIDYIEKVDNKIIFQQVGDAITDKIKAQETHNTLIDGLYHLPYVEKIQEDFPDRQTLIVSVQADKNIRAARMKARNPNDKSALNDIDYLDNYKDSIGIKEVISHADYLLVNNVDITAFSRETDLFVEKLNAGRIKP